MAKVRIKASADAMAEADKDGGEFVLPPKGYYVMQLKECNAGHSKKKDSDEEDPNKPRLECIWELIGVGVDEKPVEENYGNLWDYVSFSPESEWKRAEFVWALGLSNTKGDVDVEIDTDEVVGSRVLGRVKHEKGRTQGDPMRAKVAKLLRYKDAAMTGDPFGDKPGDAVFGDDAAADETQPYTEEELGELDPKALGNVAKDDFGLDPNELLVKVRGKVNVEKSKAAIIAAILEAQDAPDTEDSGAAEDSPF